MEDMVIVDNSVYSFAYQIDNGIPIIPFYHEQSDEEMLHLIFYLNCLATCEDVRVQNREAFELHKLNENSVAGDQNDGEDQQPVFEMMQSDELIDGGGGQEADFQEGQSTAANTQQLQHSVVEEKTEEDDEY